MASVRAGWAATGTRDPRPSPSRGASLSRSKSAPSFPCPTAPGPLPVCLPVSPELGCLSAPVTQAQRLISSVQLSACKHTALQQRQILEPDPGAQHRALRRLCSSQPAIPPPSAFRKECTCTQCTSVRARPLRRASTITLLSFATRTSSEHHYELQLRCIALPLFAFCGAPEAHRPAPALMSNFSQVHPRPHLPAPDLIAPAQVRGAAGAQPAPLPSICSSCQPRHKPC